MVVGGRVVSMGYNGTPPSMPHCSEGGCLKNSSGNCVGTVHAEINALHHCGPLAGDTMYCTDAPCLSCLKAMLAMNPEMRIVYWRDYPDADRDAFVSMFSAKLWNGGPEKVPERIAAEMLSYLPALPGERLP